MKRDISKHPLYPAVRLIKKKGIIPENYALKCTQCSSQNIDEIDIRPTFECQECGFQGD